MAVPMLSYNVALPHLKLEVNRGISLQPHLSVPRFPVDLVLQE